MHTWIGCFLTVGLALLTGCGGGDSDSDSSSEDGVVARVSLNSATPAISGAITFGYSNAAFESSGRGWRMLAQGGSVRFTFSGRHGFLYHVAGDSRGDVSCPINVTVNGRLYESGRQIPTTWASYLVPASALGDGENVVQITQATSLTLYILAVAVGDGGDFEPGGGGGNYDGTYSFTGSVYDDYTGITTPYNGTFHVANSTISVGPQDLRYDPNTVIRGTVDTSGHCDGQLRFFPGGVQTMTGTFSLTSQFSLSTPQNGRYRYTFSARRN